VQQRREPTHREPGRSPTITRAPKTSAGRYEQTPLVVPAPHSGHAPRPHPRRPRPFAFSWRPTSRGRTAVPGPGCGHDLWDARPAGLAMAELPYRGVPLPRNRDAPLEAPSAPRRPRCAIELRADVSLSSVAQNSAPGHTQEGPCRLRRLFARPLRLVRLRRGAPRRGRLHVRRRPPVRHACRGPRGATSTSAYTTTAKPRLTTAHSTPPEALRSASAVATSAR
jgi:hypothetical protein